MALFIKGNRILTEEEYYAEEGDGCGMLFFYLLLFLICLSPGIILTSFIFPLFNFTNGQLWTSVIIGCIIVMIIMCFTIGLSSKRYMACSFLCACFIGLFTLYDNDNIFWDTTQALFEMGPYAKEDEKTEKSETPKDSSIGKDREDTASFTTDPAYSTSNSEELVEEDTASFTEPAYTTTDSRELVEEDTLINEHVSDNDVDSN